MDIKEKIDKLNNSKTIRKIIIGIFIIIFGLLIFEAGILVGFRKASFSYKFGDNYYRNFGGPRGGMMGGNFMDGDDLPGGHGAAGKIVSVNLPTFTVAENGNIEKIVIISPKTDIRRFRNIASTTDIKVDDFVVVLGSPDEQGKVLARLIRLIPPPLSENSVSATTSTTKSSLK